jgi:hypothetical protein
MDETFDLGMKSSSLPTCLGQSGDFHRLRALFEFTNLGFSQTLLGRQASMVLVAKERATGQHLPKEDAR